VDRIGVPADIDGRLHLELAVGKTVTISVNATEHHS
jgi:hypothetical protein